MLAGTLLRGICGEPARTGTSCVNEQRALLWICLWSHREVLPWAACGAPGQEVKDVEYFRLLLNFSPSEVIAVPIAVEFLSLFNLNLYLAMWDG